MGLAASQARLLFITVRQNDVSAKMQRISNQNMILTRDSDEISEKYNKMLYANKMQLKSDYSDLSYNTLMGDQAINSIGSVNIITNGNGQVVLSASDKAKYGLPNDIGEKGELSSLMTLEEFITKAAGSDDAAKPIIEALGTQKAGGKDDGKNLTDEDKKNINLFRTKYGSYPQTTTLKDTKDILKDTMTTNDVMNKGWDKSDGCDDGFNDIGGKSLYDIANPAKEDYVVRVGDDGRVTGSEGAKKQAKENLKVISQVIIGKIASTFGLSDDTALQNECEDYIKTLVDKINWDDDNSHHTRSKALNGAKNDARAGLIGNGTEEFTWHSDRDFYYLNVSELVRRLTAKVMNVYSNDKSNTSNPIESVKANTGTQTLAKGNVTITINEKGYSVSMWEAELKKMFPDKYEAALAYCKPAGSSSSSGVVTDATKAACYQKLYDAINANGWSVENVDDIQTKLQNGTYYLNGGNIANNSDMYEEVPDEETRAMADRYYNTEMNKIHRKEKQLDTELSKLQTEYSALTQDMNSVKSILEQNIQRSFTYCQNG